MSCGLADRCAGRTPDPSGSGCYLFPALGFNEQLSVFAVDAQTIWATGWQSISRWDGTRWHFESAEGGDGIWASSATDAWVVSDSTVRRKTGGQWVDATPQLNTSFSGVWGSGPNDVWVVGGYAPGRAWHWTGSSWSSPVTLSTSGTMSDVWGSGPNDVWASGAGCTLMHFDGTNWAARTPPGCAPRATTPEDLGELTGISANDIWVLSNFVAYHWSGGAWTTSDPRPGTEQMREFVAVDATHVYGVGTHLFEWNGSAWSRSALPGGITQLQSITALPGGTLWAVGSSGRIAVHSGGAWAERFSPFTNPRLSGSGPGDVMLGSNEGVLRWNGTDWVDASAGLPPAPFTMHALHVPSSGSGWLVLTTGTARQVYRWNGASWASTGTVPGATAIWAADDTHVWAVGSTGTGAMVSFFDGTGWQSAVNPATSALSSVYGSSANDVWAVSTTGVLRWNGTSWSSVSVPSLSEPSEVTASSDTNVFVLSRFQYHRFNGSNWSTSAFRTTNYSRLFPASPSITWGTRLGAGNYGMLMRVTPTTETLAASGNSQLRSIWGSPWGDAWGAGTNLLITPRP